MSAVVDYGAVARAAMRIVKLAQADEGRVLRDVCGVIAHERPGAVKPAPELVHAADVARRLRAACDVRSPLGVLAVRALLWIEETALCIPTTTTSGEIFGIAESLVHAGWHPREVREAVAKALVDGPVAHHAYAPPARSTVPMTEFGLDLYVRLYVRDADRAAFPHEVARGYVEGPVTPETAITARKWTLAVTSSRCDGVVTGLLVEAFPLWVARPGITADICGICGADNEHGMARGADRSCRSCRC